MRKWNKLLAMVLAMVMVFGLTATAFAEEAKDEGEKAPVSDTEKPDAAPSEDDTKTPDAAPSEDDTKAPDAAPSEDDAKTPDAAPSEDDTKTPDAPEAVEPDLSDVEDWAKEHVAAIVKQGLMDMSETGFRPEDKMTRVELAVALYRLEKSPSIEGKESKFEDIADLTEEQQAAIVWAASEGIVNGANAEGTVFNPNGNIERQQIAKMLFIYAKAEKAAEDKLASFPDKDDVEEYAVDYINWLVAAGIMNGDDGKLNPAGNATRAQVATMLDRYITDVLTTEPAEGEDDAAKPAEGEDDTTKPAEGEDDATKPTEGEDDTTKPTEDKDDTTKPAEGEDDTTKPAEGEDDAAKPAEGDKAKA